MSSGEVDERLKSHAWKACIGVSLSGVRIPLSPPYTNCAINHAAINQSKNIFYMDDASLEAQLCYTFEQKIFLHQALTHKSYSSHNNERLEFLGDAILNMVISEFLYQKKIHYNEGQLSRWRSNIICQDHLVLAAQKIHLHQYLHLGMGELRTGGLAKPSILADAMEAIFAAIYLDGGFDAAKVVILNILAVDKSADLQELKDPKTALQEYLQGRKMGLPIYEVIRVEGQAHQQTFVLVCRIPTLNIQAQSTAGSKKQAQQMAAQQILDMLAI